MGTKPNQNRHDIIVSGCFLSQSGQVRDLKARPIFHHKRDSIEAHLTIVFAALAIAHYVETKTGVSIKKFIRTLEPIRTGIILMGNKTFGLEPEIPTEAMVLLEKLSEV